MLPNQSTNAYLQRQLEQASPTQVATMLLDGAIKFLLQAKDAIGRRDIQARFNANQRARDIVLFLLSQQDETRGEAPLRLIRIYSALLNQLLQVDLRNDPDVCDKAIAHLRALRQGFASLHPPVVSTAATGPTAPLKHSA